MVKIYFFIQIIVYTFVNEIINNLKTNNMKATIKIKNPYTYPTYTVMIGKEIIKGFYSKKEAIELRNKLNNN